MYKGYCCSIIGTYGKPGPPEEAFYEIEFVSQFNDNDNLLNSQERHPDFEFPETHSCTIVSVKDIVRLEIQDLYYKTFFC